MHEPAFQLYRKKCYNITVIQRGDQRAWSQKMWGENEYRVWQEINFLKMCYFSGFCGL